jgi:hypothetical protein
MESCSLDFDCIYGMNHRRNDMCHSDQDASKAQPHPGPHFGQPMIALKLDFYLLS